MQRDSVESLSNEIDELTKLLRDTHIREGVLKAKLNIAVEKKYRLLREEENLGIQPSPPQVLPQPQRTRPSPIRAFVIDDESKDDHSSTPASVPSCVNYSHSHRRGGSRVHRDREGSVIQVADEVEFLTPGRNTSNTGIVQRLTSSYVHCIDSNSVHTKRAPRNVRVIESYHECN